MRAKPILLVSVATLAGALALAVGAAFVPQVQTWVARRAIASLSPGATLVRVSAGPNRMSLQGLRLDLRGAVLVVPTADADLGVLPAVLGKGYLIRNLVAKGWTLDLTRSGPGTAATPAAGTTGGAGPLAARAIGAVLAAFNVPTGLSLEGVDLEGVVILPDDGGRPIGRARVILTGGGLAAGRSGTFRCDASVTLDDEAAPVSAVLVHATLGAAMDGSGTFARADLRADATASGRQFPRGIGLSGIASAARGLGKTTYRVALVRGGERVASIDADSPDGSRKLSGEWTLDLKDSDLAPFALGRRLPEFDVAGGGSYALDLVTGDVRAAGKARASADRLGLVAGGLSALGHVDLTADFDVAREGDSLRVDRLETSLAGATPVASVRALQPFEFNVATGELKVARPSGDLVGISVTGIPLGWIHGALPGLDLAGADAQGEFVMRAEDGRLALRTNAPLVSAGVSVSRAGRAIASGLEVSSFLLADYSPRGWQLQVAPLSIRSEGIRMLSLEARLGRLAGPGQPVKAAGSWSASLPVLLSQPFAARMARLSGGEASGSFEASLGNTRELQVKVAVRDLSLASGPQAAIPSITSDARADFDPDGRITFNVPLRLDYGTRTVDMVYSGTLSRRGATPSFDAHLSAESLSAEDFAMVTGLSDAGASVMAAAPSATGPSPFWPAAEGRLYLSLQNVALARIVLHDVRGMLVVEPTSLRIESGMAGLGDGSAARVDGEIAFTPGEGPPYSMKATVSADNVDSAPLFTAADPDKPAAVEGRFKIAAHVTGSGTGLRDLFDRVQGDCTLVSKAGRFRGLRTNAIESVRQAPSMIIGALDSVSSLFGKKSDKIGEDLVEAANGLSEIHYDQMNVTALRGADLDLQLTEISLIAPEVRVTGTGRITYAEGVPLESQPLAVDLDMGVRGKLGSILGVIGMLKDGHDELGYTPLYQPIHLGGTLSNIDTGQWKDMLVQAPLRKGGGLIDKLLGR